MLDRLTFQETDTFGEVNAALNRIIDYINSTGQSIGQYNTKHVDKHNAEIDKFNKSVGFKKKGGE